MGRANLEHVIPGIVSTDFGVSSCAAWKVRMFSNAVSIACFVPSERVISSAGKGAFRTEDWRSAFSNFAVYSSRAASPRVLTALMIFWTIGMIWSVFWIGRESNVVLSFEDNAFESNTRILIFVSSVGGGSVFNVGASPIFSAGSTALVSETLLLVIHFGFASPLRLVIFFARLSSCASTSDRETPFATHFVMAKKSRSATSHATSFGSEALQASSASSMILEFNNDGSENNRAT